SVDLSLSISYEDEAGKARSLFIPFKVKDVNHREEAMDLFFKAARIAGFDYYSVLRSDPRWLEIESSKGKVEGSVQVPVQGERQDYARDTALATVKEPGLKVKPFDPKSFSSDNELLEWAPGDRVKFFKPKPSISTILGFSIVIAAIAGGISFVVLPDFAWLLPFKPDALAASLAVAAAAGVSFGAGFHYLAKEQEALFDWGFGKVTFRAGSASRGFSFKEIQGLSLKGLSETRSSGGKNKSTYTVYWCELYAQLPGGNELVAATNEFREDAETPYDMSLPLAVELANALNVPWTWVDYSKKQPFNVNWSLNFK
ncbi:MAG TPA: hypothetical protein VJI67_01685, partial [archaeon]|nr:hypothetical protein [archaeon]